MAAENNDESDKDKQEPGKGAAGQQSGQSGGSEKAGDSKKTQDKDGKDKDGKGDKDKDDKSKDDKPSKRKPVWPWIVAGIVVIGFIAVVLAIIYVPTSNVWSDDAYVTAHYATIAPQVSGIVSSVEVEENQPVRAGQLLATIDDRNFLTAVANAEAMLARDRAQLNEASASIARQPVLTNQSQAQVPAAQAQVVFAQHNENRYRNLARTGAGTMQERQQTVEALKQAQSTLDQAKKGAEASKLQMAVLQAQRAAAAATVKSDEAQVAQAKLNLSYTRIVAPFDGMTAERTVQVGNYVGPGVALMAVVPLDRVYIEANYRETALRHVLPGQHVRIHVDAYDIMLDGFVDSLPPASGAAFGAIQPNNATGNFTKIVQRLPVRILVSPGQNEARLLRMGFSVETTIYTGLADVRREQRGDAARITER